MTLKTILRPQNNHLFHPQKMAKGAICSLDQYCEGYQNPGSSGKNYIIGLALGVGKTSFNLRHDGSQLLDEIDAFDRAEVHDTYLGQINMITVSSFCGINGLIWGYDLAPADRLRQPHHLGIRKVGKNGKNIPVYSARPLLEATKKLFGTVKNKRFPLLPGSHVPCAGKHFTEIGPRHIYSAIAIGIPKNRSRAACLIMEDLGWIPLRQNPSSQRAYKRLILENITKSIVQIGKNQNIDYQEIFTDLADIQVEQGKVGCALVAAPYFTLAKKAVPKNNPEILTSIRLSEWERQTSSSFLDNR